MRSSGVFRTFLVAAVGLSLAVAPSAVAQESAEAAAEAPGTPDWQYPREGRSGGKRVNVHEPTVVGYDGATGAVELSVPLEITDPIGQVAWAGVRVKGQTHVDIASRLFAIDGLEPAGDELAEGPAKALEGLDPMEAIGERLLMRLELLLGRPGELGVEDAKGLSTLPPDIHVRNEPAVLVQVDGEPVLAQVADFSLEYVTNSASDIFHQPNGGKWFMLVDGHWAEAKELVGPWKWLEKKLPVVLTQLPITHPRGHVRRYVPGTKRYRARVGDKAVGPEGALPEVIVSQKPAELVLLHGDPLFTMVPGVKLMSVANTESDLLFHPRSGLFYLVVGGRWFQAEDVDGKWRETYGKLPEEFALIPRDHIRAHVRWSVPGTPEAAEAARLTAVRERMTLHPRSRADARYVEKTPKSAPIEGIEARLVNNTEDDVLTTGKAYYACVRGAWFRSDDGKTKWEAATTLPESIQAIPAASGLFHVNSVRPLGPDGEKGFAFAFTGGYRGMFVHRGAAVYGTGWDRRGLMRNKNWYPAARTYGESRWYDPVSGTFQPRSAQYTPEGQLVADEWSPYTASYGRVVAYADRYSQGGRRAFPYHREDDVFRTACGRPDLVAMWKKDALAREGLALDAFPLGDRSAETRPETPPLAVDETGIVYRVQEDKIEAFADGKWAVPKVVRPDVSQRLTTLERAHARAEQLRAWMKKRAGTLPVNPVATPRK